MTEALAGLQASKFVARQPILGERADLFGYELLFRAGRENRCQAVNLDMATSSVLDTALRLGLEKLTGGRRAFVNCTRDSLINNSASLLPREQVVVEILETSEPDEELLNACRRLKEQGYSLALDDFVDTPAWQPFVALADFIKVDFRLTPRAEQEALAARYRSRGLRMLAEKVETQEEFREAKRMGYSLFQGYFFCRPELMEQRAIPASKLAYLELLQAALQPELDTAALALKIKREASLTFRLLRYLNSAFFGLRSGVRSVQHAVALLGEREMRKWIAVICVAVLGDGKPDELITLPLIRGRFCELLAPLTGLAVEANDLFLLGLLSVMDAVLNQPLEVVMADLPVRQQIKDALLAGSGSYRTVLDLAIAQERADWGSLTTLASGMGLEETRIPELYVSAVDWAALLRRGMGAVQEG